MPNIRILAVAAGRGGTGKSTLAFAIADTLRRLDSTLDVALVDLDPQAGLTGYAKRPPAADPLEDPPVDVHGIPLFRGGRALAHATDTAIIRHLERTLAGSTGRGDRVVVADMAPALTDVAHRVVFNRDDVMLLGAIKTEPGSFQSLNELVAYVAKRGLPYILVPTIHRSVLLNNTMLLTMRQQHAGHVADAVFPLDGKAAECVVAGQPVTMYARRSKAAKAVVSLVEELFGSGPAADDGAARSNAAPDVAAPRAIVPPGASPAASPAASPGQGPLLTATPDAGSRRVTARRTTAPRGASARRTSQPLTGPPPLHITATPVGEG